MNPLEEFFFSKGLSCWPVVVRRPPIFQAANQIPVRIQSCWLLQQAFRSFRTIGAPDIVSSTIALPPLTKLFGDLQFSLSAFAKTFRSSGLEGQGGAITMAMHAPGDVEESGLLHACTAVAQCRLGCSLICPETLGIIFGGQLARLLLSLFSFGSRVGASCWRKSFG